MINKTSNETNKIIYSKSYITIKSSKKKKFVTSGEAIYKILRKKDLKKIFDKTYKI